MDNEILCLFGVTGCGKSSLTRELVPLMRRRLILDTRHRDYEDGCIVHTAADLVDYWNQVGGKKEFSIILRPREDRAVRAFWRLAIDQPDLWVVIEETSEWSSAYKPDPDIEHLVKYGRHTGLSVLSVAQRPAQVQRIITAMATGVVAHRTTEPRDLAYFRQRGMDVTDLPHLPTFHWRMAGRSDLMDAWKRSKGI